jgi:hypothetical protein
MSGGNPAGHGIARIGARHTEAVHVKQVIEFYYYVNME